MGDMPADKCRVPQAFWRAFAELGLASAVVLRQARLPATIHTNPTAVLTTAQLFSLWKAVEELALRPDLALKVVKAMDRSGHQPAFLAASYAADFRDAILRIDRFKRNSPSEKFRFEERNGEFSISKEWFHATEPEPALSIDLSFSFLLELGRRGTGGRITPVRVEFTRPAPASGETGSLFDCPIRYDAPSNKLILRSSDVDLPFTGRNSELLDLLAPALAASRSDLDEESTLAEQVKIVLKRALASGRPDVADVAARLGTSARTLQRRITDEGTTFRALLTQARQEVADHLLADPFIGVDEVAVMLGYQDTSSFYRGFRQWRGTTPSRWRALNEAPRASATH